MKKHIMIMLCVIQWNSMDAIGPTMIYMCIDPKPSMLYWMGSWHTIKYPKNQYIRILAWMEYKPIISETKEQYDLCSEHWIMIIFWSINIFSGQNKSTDLLPLINKNRYWPWINDGWFECMHAIRFWFQLYAIVVGAVAIACACYWWEKIYM